MVDDVLTIDRETIEAAKSIVLGRRRLSARDAIHAAVMERHGITTIASFDTGFDAVPGIERLVV